MRFRTGVACCLPRFIAILVLSFPFITYANQTIDVTIRDFRIAHPDFQDSVSGLVTGLVDSTLPPDKKPIFVAPPGSGAITDASTFAQWYNDVPGVNSSTTLPLTFTETAPGSGIFEFKNSAFFPIDGILFGNEGLSHNYHFTLELHTSFTYQPGQTFQFTGDDDLWVYINNQLVVDLGGVHGSTSGSVALDTLGLTPGNTYDFDLYFAERFTSESNFHIQTSIVFNPNPPTSDSTAFDVDSTRGWQTTTLKATTGQQLSFSAVGAWSVDHRNFSYVDSEGYSPEEDTRIQQGCKLDPSLPYGRLLVRVGDDLSFQAIGSEDTLTADRDGFLAFRIHDADGCLGDNAGSLRVTVTGSGIESAPIAPIFYCITGPGQGGGCMEVYKNPVPSGLPPVPGFLTSQHGPQCVSALYTHLSIILTVGSIVNPALVPFAAVIALPAAADVAIDTTFVAKRALEEFETTIEPQLRQTSGITDGRYWGILIQEALKLGACEVIDTITLQACHDLLAELFQTPPSQVLPLC